MEQIWKRCGIITHDPLFHPNCLEANHFGADLGRANKNNGKDAEVSGNAEGQEMRKIWDEAPVGLADSARLRSGRVAFFFSRILSIKIPVFQYKTLGNLVML